MPWRKHTFQPKPIKDIIDTAYIVLDTNVLLAAYQWRDVTINEILDTLDTLVAKDRLRIPAHAITEFAIRRPELIREMIKNLEELVSSWNKPKDLLEVVPTLVKTDEFVKAQQARSELIESRKKFVSELQVLQDKLRGLLSEDPVLERYEAIFTKAYFRPDSIKEDEDLIKEYNERIKKGLPPGLKDKGKESNASGDYIIWAHMLALNNDVIFVSNDVKPDWVITDSHNKIIATRRELIEEFYENTGGKSFVQIKPVDVFQLLKPDMSEETKMDLEEAQLDEPKVKYVNLTKSPLNIIRKKLKKHNISLDEDLLKFYVLLYENHYDLYVDLLDKTINNFTHYDEDGKVNFYIDYYDYLYETSMKARKEVLARQFLEEQK